MGAGLRLGGSGGGEGEGVGRGAWREAGVRDEGRLGVGDETTDSRSSSVTCGISGRQIILTVYACQPLACG